MNKLNSQNIKILLEQYFDRKPWIYWLDFGLSTIIGWFAFGMTCLTPFLSFSYICWFVVATFILYRALFFAHELVHFGPNEMRPFYYAWNILLGIPFMFPSSYFTVHLHHHRIDFYGTKHDPLYAPILGSSPLKILLPFVTVPFVGIPLFLLRYLIISPLSLIVGGKLREYNVQRLSAATINPKYVRPKLDDRERRELTIHEISVFVFLITLIFLTATGSLPKQILIQWYLTACVILSYNYFRLLIEHVYDDAETEKSLEEQIMDTITINPPSFLARLILPLHDHYHALHHWFPSIPYHALHKAHIRLMSHLNQDHPYLVTVKPNISSALTSLFQGKKAYSSTN